MRKIVLVFILIILSSLCFAQSDSLKIFFTGYDFKGEKFKVLHESKEVLKFKAGERYKYSFTIPKDSTWKYGRPLSIHIYRKGKFGLCYRDLEFNAFYEPGSKYLQIYRDGMLRNKYAVDYKWVNEEPFLIR